jgi:hypothetical protein
MSLGDIFFDSSMHLSSMHLSPKRVLWENSPFRLDYFWAEPGQVATDASMNDPCIIKVGCWKHILDHSDHQTETKCLGNMLLDTRDTTFPLQNWPKFRKQLTDVGKCFNLQPAGSSLGESWSRFSSSPVLRVGLSSSPRANTKTSSIGSAEFV